MIKSRAKYFAIFSWRQFVGLVSQLVAAARLGLDRLGLASQQSSHVVEVARSGGSAPPPPGVLEIFPKCARFFLAFWFG